MLTASFAHLFLSRGTLAIYFPPSRFYVLLRHRFSLLPPFVGTGGGGRPCSRCHMQFRRRCKPGSENTLHCTESETMTNISLAPVFSAIRTSSTVVFSLRFLLLRLCLKSLLPPLKLATVDETPSPKLATSFTRTGVPAVVSPLPRNSRRSKPLAPVSPQLV